MGYIVETKDYRFYDPTSKKLLIGCDVVFDEKSTWDLNKVQHSPSSLQRVDDLMNQQLKRLMMTMATQIFHLN